MALPAELNAAVVGVHAVVAANDPPVTVLTPAPMPPVITPVPASCGRPLCTGSTGKHGEPRC